ncbi:hypothetical protein EC957_001225 [Mortierella hygrophila]|uniref:Uncharacterized protein n=1 Tax=Mortierella hygrophila TaxID=979708 RepID=A0A9P6K2G1_9FUNG|nr:hypothetical protein EC957_001225 [Mortierella hygrophila]
MAYALPSASYPQRKSYYDFSHIVLIQSNPNPQNLTTLSWSLISAWPRTANTLSDIYSSLACHVDPLTGVFTMMSNFSGNNPAGDSYQNLQSMPLRPPGGFQYTPPVAGIGPGKWADFGVSQDYEWGNVSATFDLFNWPGTSELYQARIGNSTVGTIQLSLLTSTAATLAGGPATFTDVANYTLNPDVHGYPMKVAYANSSIYQLGRLITDKRTGEFGYYLTRIPLDSTARGASGFTLPADLVAHDASAIQNCQMETTKIWYSSPQATLYVLCSVPALMNQPPSDVSGRLFVSWFKNGDKALSKRSNISTDTAQLCIQPIDRNDSSGVWAYLSSPNREQHGVLIDPVSGNLDPPVFPYAPYFPVSISDPYGEYRNEGTPSTTFFLEEHFSLVIAGAVIGCLLILAVICYIPFRRRWRRRWRGKWGIFKTQTWPRWMRKVRLKLIDLLKEKEDAGRGDRDAEGKALQGKRDVSKDNEDGFNNNKFEEHLMSSLEGLEGCDKVLVTDDMDLSGLESPLTMMDVATGYMSGVRLEAHPRPGIITSLAISQGGNSSNVGSSSSFGDGDSPPPPEYLTLATPSAPPVSTSFEDTISIPQPITTVQIHVPSQIP